ncbi:MAG: hypothetical protein WEA10_03380 [Actinomycetota bacterium]
MQEQGWLPPLPPRPDEPPPPRRRSKLVVGFFVFLALFTAGIPGIVLIEEIRDHGQYAILHRSEGRPVVWNTCTPIRYVVSDELAPEGTDADMREAIRRVEDASGLDFVEVGRADWTLDEFFRAGGAVEGSGGADWAPVLIGWEDAPSFADEGAYGGSNAIEGEGAWRDRYVTGFVIMNARQELEPGFAQEGGWGPAFMHELGHLVGLGHVPKQQEIMAPVHFPPWPIDWGEGDRRGLTRIGASACRDGTAPPPRAFPGEDLLSPPTPVGG